MHQLKSSYISQFKYLHSQSIHTCFGMIATNAKDHFKLPKNVLVCNMSINFLLAYLNLGTYFMVYGGIPDQISFDRQ